MGRREAVGWFLVTAILLALPALIALAMNDRFTLHAAINAHHAPWMDLIFRYATHLGDGLVAVLLALVLLFTHGMRSFLMMGASWGFSSIITQLLKRLVFPDVHRPARHRDVLGDMHWLPDLDLNHHFSFPSGHSTTAFAMCLALAVIIARPAWGVFLAVIAGMLAFSRVYLSQHFTEDIVAGAAIGTMTTVLVYRWLYVSAFAGRPWLDRRPLTT